MVYGKAGVLLTPFYMRNLLNQAYGFAALGLTWENQVCTIRFSIRMETRGMKAVMQNKWRKIIAVLLILGAAGICLFLGRDSGKSATQSIFAMDTYMDITAYGRNSEKAVEAAVQEIYRLEELLSTGSETSEVTMLNKSKQGEVSEDYAYLLGYSGQLWESTEGAFDITIYPIMKAWGFAGKKYRVPAQEEIDLLLHYVDFSQITLDEESGRVVLPQQVEVDFGGIAKGYTSARVAQIMKEYGVESAIMNLGGNVQVVGTKTDGSLWKVAIKSPVETQDYLGVISVEDKAIITSGGYERYFEENGKTYHHIIDPKTGKPAENGLVSVTIVCADGTLADGLSTSLFVMGKEEAIAYWRAHQEAFEAVLYDEEGMLYITEGLVNVFSSELEYEIISKE